MMRLIDGDRYEGMMGGVDENTMEIANQDMMVADSMVEPMMGKSLPVSGGFMPPYYYEDDALDVEDRVYQKSSSHSVIVNNVSEYLRGIKEYVLSIDGKVLSSDISSGEDYNSGSLYIKVPVIKFDEATARVTENVDKVINEYINADDVTGQLINTTENLQDLKDAKSLKEASLKDAKTEVEKRRYEIEIERLDRQIASAEKATDRVEQKVEYASVSVTAADSERYFNPGARLSVRDEFSRAWDSAKQFLGVAVYFGIWVIAYSIIWLPIVWIVKKIFKKFEKQN